VATLREYTAKYRTTFVAVALSAAASGVFAASDAVTVGGQAMYPSKDIADNAIMVADKVLMPK
jgi:hypothetical protein